MMRRNWRGNGRKWLVRSAPEVVGSVLKFEFLKGWAL